MSLAIEGEIDLATVDELKAAIDGALEADGSNLIVDLTKTGFMDSTGLKTLVVANRQFSDLGREFALAVAAGPISRLIDLSGIASTMKIVSDPEELIEVGSS